MRICISDLFKYTGVFLIIAIISSNSLFGQIINPNIPSHALDSLFNSIQPLDTLFCHSTKGILEKYRDTISEILFTKGKFHSLRLDGSQCVLKNQNSELTFQNENGQIFTIIPEPNNLIIKGGDDSIINVLKESRRFMENTQFISNIKKDHFSLNNIINLGGAKISTVCDTNFQRVREIWIQFPDSKSLHVKVASLESMPFEFISYEDLNNYILSAVFNRFGQVQYFQISNSDKDYRFWINFRSKRKPKKISSIEYICSDVDDKGIKQYAGYMVYSYNRNGRIKKSRLDINYCK